MIKHVMAIYVYAIITRLLQHIRKVVDNIISVSNRFKVAFIQKRK